MQTNIPKPTKPLAQPTHLAKMRRTFVPYYGWCMVVMGAIAMAATLPGRTHGLGLITKRLLEDFKTITTQDFAHYNLWATLIGALFCLPCGWLIDRLGVRIVATVVIGSLAAVVWWLSRVTDPILLFIAITLTRGIGQSMLSVVSITMVGKWFQRRIGMAMGIYSVVMSMLMAVGTGVLGSQISAKDWRVAWHELSILLMIVTPVMFLLSRNSPRDQSLEFANSAHGAGESSAVSATLSQALSTFCFWIFAGSISFFGMVSAGISLFNQYILEERGFQESTFHNVLVIGFLTGMVTNLVAGGLSRRFPLQCMLAFAMFLLAASYASLTMVQTVGEVYAYAVLQGIAGGTLTVMFFAVWAQAFGPTHLGRIQAAAQMMTVLASAIGPVVIAESRVARGSYNQVLMVFAAIAAALGVAAVFTTVPQASLGIWKRESSLFGNFPSHPAPTSSRGSG